MQVESVWFWQIRFRAPEAMVSDIDLDGAVFVPISKQTLFQLVTVAEPQFRLFDPFSDVLL